MEYLKILCTIFILGIAGNAISKDENVLKNGGAEIGQGCWAGVTLSDKDSYSGKYCFGLAFKKQAKKKITYWYIVKIDPNKLYNFSMKTKSVGSEPCKVLVEFITYNKFMRGFNYVSIYPRMETESKLVADAKLGDSVLKIANGQKWFKHPRFAVAFYTRRAYTDIPNLNLSRFGIKSLTKKDKHWEVELKHPLKKTYSAGVNVRMHRAGPYFNVVIPSQTTTNEWRNFSCQLKGVRKLFKRQPSGKIKKFWYATAYIGIRIIVKGTPGKSELLIDDISLTER